MTVVAVLLLSKLECTCCSEGVCVCCDARPGLGDAKAVITDCGEVQACAHADNAVSIVSGKHGTRGRAHALRCLTICHDSPNPDQCFRRLGVLEPERTLPLEPQSVPFVFALPHSR